MPFPPNVTVHPNPQANPNEKHFTIAGLLNNSPQGQVVEIRNITFYLSKSAAYGNIHIKYDHQNFSFIHDCVLQIRLHDAHSVLEYSTDIPLNQHRDTSADIIHDIHITTAQFDHTEVLYFATYVTWKRSR